MVCTVYKGVGLGISVVAADFHDTTQIVTKQFTFFCMILDLSNQFGYGAQRIKAQFSALIESPYTTLYQTVRTCHDLSSDEVA